MTVSFKAETRERRVIREISLKVNRDYASSMLRNAGIAFSHERTNGSEFHKRIEKALEGSIESTYRRNLYKNLLNLSKEAKRLNGFVSWAIVSD